MCWNDPCFIYFVGKDRMIQSMAFQNAWCGFRSFGLALHKLWRIPSAGHLWKSSLQPCLDVSNWDASSMRCRHWCCGIIMAYLGHVLKWSLLHLLCWQDHVIQSMACQNAWCGFRSFGLALHKLWRIPSAGHLLKVFSSAMFRCIQLRMQVAWDVVTGVVGLYRLILGMCWIGPCCIYFVQGPRDSEHGMPECMVWIPFVWAGSSQALANSFRRASFESLLFCPFRMYLNWDITSIEKHSLIYVVFLCYDGHVFKWSCPKEVIPFSTFLKSLFVCAVKPLLKFV